MNLDEASLTSVDSTMQFFTSPSRIDRELIAEFFMTFARAEYALKEAGLVKAVGCAGRFEIDWDRFADEIAEEFARCELECDSSIRYLMEKPPQKEILTAQGLDWSPRSPQGQSRERFLVRSVTTVRNNLFHDGKKPGSPLIERDRELVAVALQALKRFVTLHATVLSKFQEMGPESGSA